MAIAVHRLLPCMGELRCGHLTKLIKISMLCCSINVPWYSVMVEISTSFVLHKCLRMYYVLQRNKHINVIIQALFLCSNKVKILGTYAFLGL